MDWVHASRLKLADLVRHDYQANWKLLAAAVVIHACAVIVGGVIVRLHPLLSEPLDDLPSHGPELILSNLAIILLLQVGFISGGVISVVVLIMNGLFQGAFWVSAAQSGMLVPVVAVTLPHGILEFPALWIASAVGLSGGRFVQGYLLRGESDIRCVPWSLCGVAVVLILLAGLIEVGLSIPLARLWGEAMRS